MSFKLNYNKNIFLKENLNIIYNILGNQGIILLSNLLIFLLISFYYGPLFRGEFAILNSSFLLFASVFSLGIGKTLPFIFKKDITQNHRVIYNYVIITIFLSFLAILIYYLFNSVFPNVLKVNIGYISYFILIIPYLIWSQNSINVLNELKLLGAQVKIASKILLAFCVILFFAIFYFNIEFKHYLFLHSVSFFFLFIVEIILVFKNIKIEKYNIDYNLIFLFIKSGSKIYIETLVGLSNSTFFYLIMPYFISLELIGNFSFSTQILGIFNLPSLILHQFYMKKNSINNKYWDIQRKQFFFLLIILTIAIFLTILLFHFFNNKIVSLGYIHFFEIFKFLILSSYFSYFSYFMYSQWLIKGYFLKYSINNLISFIIAIPLSYLMMKKFGILGATISFSFIYMFSLPGNIILFKKLSNVPL